MAQDKRFSVITPIYKENYINFDRMLLCLKEQDYHNVEVIIVYNSPALAKSRAGVRKILRASKCPFPVNEVDAGYKPNLKYGNHSRAFNRGVVEASGDYLLFLDPDIELQPGVLREYKDAFDTHPEVDFVYGDYDFKSSGGRVKGRRYSDYELRCANYISGAFPIKATAFRGWDEDIQSLQDWDMWYSAIDAGAKGFYLARPCFLADVPSAEGISAQGAQKWKQRYALVREKHGFPVSATAVTSLGAPDHATNTAELLGVDTRVLTNIVSFKPHDYRNIYLIGFYSQSPNAEDPMMAVRQHLGLFYPEGKIKENPVKGAKIIHWVGTDIFMLQHKTSWMGVQFIAKMLTDQKIGIIHLTECQATHDELSELGIPSTVVPLPPKRLYAPVPFPPEFTVGVYINPTQDMYFEGFLYEIADAMPDIQFKFFGNRDLTKKDRNKEWVGWVDMATFLPTISALVRLTRHDGLPLGPLEAMMAGRNVLATQKLPHALHTELVNGEPNREEVIAKIREMQDMPINTEGSAYWNKELAHDTFRNRIGKYLK